MSDIDDIIAARIAEYRSEQDAQQDAMIAAQAALIADMQSQIDALKALHAGEPSPAPVPVPAPTPTPVPTPVPAPSGDLVVGDFEILSCNLFEDGDQPGLQPVRPPGLRYAPMIYQQHFQVIMGRYDPVTPEGIASAVANLKDLRDGVWKADWPGVLIDIESWAFFPYASGATLRKNLKLYADACKKLADATGQPVGLYNVAPAGGIVAWTQVGAGTSPAGKARLQAIRDANDIAAEEIIPHVQFLAPQLYTYYDSPTQVGHQQHMDTWKLFAQGTIAEARRIAPDLPCLPVIWHEFHNGGMYKDYRKVPEDYWRMELQTIKAEGADGAIWWGGYDLANKYNQPLTPFADSAVAWKVVQEFMP